MGGNRNANWEPEGERQLGISRHKWENNIKTDVKELGW
jgi:hypothetical protein